jgi:hypothetical protein
VRDGSSRASKNSVAVTTMPNRNSKACLIAFLAASGAFAQTTAVDLSNQAKEADFRSFSFTRTIKTGPALPSTCAVGDVFLLSTASTGRSLHVCQTANVWSLQGGEIASQTEAEFGINDERTMTPLKTSQAIAAQCSLPSPMGMGGGLLTTDGSTSSWTRRLVMAPLTEPITNAGHTISTNRFFVQVNPSASYSLTSTPTLSPGTDGQFLVLANLSSTHSLTLQDHSSLTGSNLKLGGTNATLGPLQSIHLVYSALADAWIRAGQIPGAAPAGGEGGGGGAGAVSSVFGRVGAVTAQAGDYTASQITGAVSESTVYADPPWITSLAYSKLNGAPTLRYQSVRVNGAADMPQRARVNFVAGANVTITAADDSPGNQTNITVSAAGGGGGGTGPTTKTYMAAKCQNTVAGAGFSMGTTDAPVPVCDSGSETLFGVLRFTTAGQKVYDSFPLPPVFSSMSVVLTARTASTSGNSVFAIETACVGDNESLGTGATGGPAWNAPQVLTLAAKTTANRHTIGTETPLTVTGCSANELFLFRISRHSSTTAENPELISVSFKVQ